MLYMFDGLLLISEGYPMYYGKASESMEYFLSLRFSPEIAMNLAEFLLNLATGQVNDIRVPQDISAINGHPGPIDPEKAVVKYLQVKYKSQLDLKANEENRRNVKAPKKLQMEIQVKKNWTLTWWEQFMILSKRTFRERYQLHFVTFFFPRELYSVNCVVERCLKS